MSVQNMVQARNGGVPRFLRMRGTCMLKLAVKTNYNPAMSNACLSWR